MRRDMPEGCDYAGYPSFGWGRILTAPRMMQHLSERYVCWRIAGVLYLVIFGRYFERRSVSFVRSWADREVAPVVEVNLDPGVERAVLDEDERMDRTKAASRFARRMRLFEAQRSGPQ